MLELSGLCAEVIFACMAVLWLVSLALRDASIVDLFWGTGLAMVSLLGLRFGEGAAARRELVALLCTLWGARLSVHLALRNLGHGEDFRYASMRRRIPGFALVSLPLVFGLQGALILVVSLPAQAAATARAPAQLGLLDAAGTALWLLGLLFEAVGDWQLARFKADPASAGQVMDRGLWRYTRHPNYFGDCCVWWGIYLVALSTGAWWTAAGPLVMTVLLLRVSGVALLERSIARRRPGYAEYAARTSAFVPWWPRPPGRS